MEGKPKAAKPTKVDWAKVDYLYPQVRMKIRRDVYEWLETRGGLRYLKRLLYDLYERLSPADVIAARRAEHARQFQEYAEGKGLPPGHKTETPLE